MGDPRKIRAKVRKPSHPWQKERIDEEAKLVREYGIPRKRELWKMNTILADAKTQVKRLAEETGEQKAKEQEQLMKRLLRLGIMKEGANFESILGLTVRDVLERRLQTVLAKKELARSVKQARQFIIHGHIMLNGTKITSPAYLVPTELEATISFDPRSQLNDQMHPERIPKDKLKEELKKKEKLTAEAKKKEEKVQAQKEADAKKADAEKTEEAKKEEEAKE